MTYNAIFYCPEHPAVEAVENAYDKLKLLVDESEPALHNLIAAKEKTGYTVYGDEASVAASALLQKLQTAQCKLLEAVKVLKQAINNDEFDDASDRLKAAVGNHMICVPELYFPAIDLVHSLSRELIYPVYTGKTV